MNIKQWLEAHSDKFTITESPFSQFITYVPKYPLLYLGESITEIDVKVRVDKESIIYDDNGEIIPRLRDVEPDFIWQIQ